MGVYGNPADVGKQRGWYRHGRLRQATRPLEHQQQAVSAGVVAALCSVLIQQ